MKRPRLFPNIVFVFIGLNVTIVGITIYLAHSDPTFAVEPDYYQQALRWDDTARRREHSAALRWTASASLARGHDPADGRLQVTLTGPSGEPLTDATLTAILFPSLHARDRQTPTLEPLAPGVYSAPVRVDTPGLWQCRLTATRAGELFTTTIELLPLAPSAAQEPLR